MWRGVADPDSDSSDCRRSKRSVKGCDELKHRHFFAVSPMSPIGLILIG